MTASAKDPFPERIDVRFWKRLEHWEVGYLCTHDERWHWERCKATSRPSALKEALEVLINLIRESADRWNKSANEALENEIALRREASTLERRVKP